MRFLITAYDSKKEGTLERRMRVRPDHLANLEKVMVHCNIPCAGGLTDENGNLKGSFLVMEFETRAELDAYLASEPYIINDVWEEIHIDTCNVVIKDNCMG